MPFVIKDNYEGTPASTSTILILCKGKELEGNSLKEFLGFVLKIKRVKR